MIVDTQDKYNYALKRLGEWTGDLYFDTETNGLVWWKHHAISVQIGTELEEFYFPFRHPGGGNLEILKLKELASVLSTERMLVGWHARFDVQIMIKEGLVAPKTYRDPMLGFNLLNENLNSLKMETVMAQFIDPSAALAEHELVDRLRRAFGNLNKDVKKDLCKLPYCYVAHYGLQDIKSTRLLRHFADKHLPTWDLKDLYIDVCRFAALLCRMETRGVAPDQDEMRRLGEISRSKAEEIEKDIRARFMADISPSFDGVLKWDGNPRSPPQMKAWLGYKYGVEDTKANTLKMIEDEVESQLLLEYRMWDKLQTSFINPYWKFIAPDGKFHPHFYICSPGSRDTSDLHGTSSGRLSCDEPNAQQWPEAFKKCIKADPGKEFVEVDLSQAELRVGAYYSEKWFKDSSLADLIRQGLDLHQASADAAGFKGPNARRNAKNRNFAVEYGAGAAKLASMCQSSIAKEQAYLKAFFKRFPGSWKLTEHLQRTADKQGYIRLFTGRILHFNSERVKAYKAKNRLIQGTVAEILRLALLACEELVPEADLLLTVHDQGLFQVEKGSAYEVGRKLKHVFEAQMPQCSVALKADVKIGTCYGELQKVDYSKENQQVAPLG